MGEKICITDGNVYVSLESTGEEIYLVDLDSVFLKGNNKRIYIGWDMNELAAKVFNHLKETYPDTKWTVAGYRKA